MTREAVLRKRDTELTYDLHALNTESKSVPELAPWAKKINGSTVSADGKAFTCSLLVGLTVRDGDATVFVLCFGNTVHFGAGRTGTFVGTLFNDFKVLCVVFDSGSGALELCSAASIESAGSTVEEVDPAGLTQAWDLCFAESKDGSFRHPNLRPRHKLSSQVADAGDDGSKPSKRKASPAAKAPKKPKKPKAHKTPKPPPARSPTTSPPLHVCHCTQCRGKKKYASKKTINTHAERDARDARDARDEVWLSRSLSRSLVRGASSNNCTRDTLGVSLFTIVF